MQALTKSEKISLSTTEIAKRIRQQLKVEFRGCKFSVRSEYYSMGSSVSVYLMKADIRIKRSFEELMDYIFMRYKQNHYTPDQVKQLQGEGYHQLNPYTLRGDYDPDHWCNGVFLTEEGHKFLKRVVEIADHYNYDDSDIQTDYYSVNFSFSLSLGKWDKPFIDGADSGGQPTIEPQKAEVVDWSKEVFQI